MWTDIRHSIRALAQSRSVFALSVLCLALGIGVVTMVFAVVNGVLLRPVPFRDPAGLLQIAEASRAGDTVEAVSLHSFSAWQRQPLAADLAAILAWLVARQMLVVTGSGIAIGTLVAAGTTWVLQSVLFEVSATDPISVSTTAALLVAVCGLAGWAPAHRASAADPAVSLRE